VDLTGPEATHLDVPCTGRLDIRRSVPATLVAGDHRGRAELEVGIVHPADINEYDPFIGEALADLVPREFSRLSFAT